MAKNSERAQMAKMLGPASEDFPELVDIGPAVFFKASMAYWQVLLDSQREIQKFLSDGYKRDAKLERSFAGGGNILDLIKVQQDWVASAMKEYVHESAKLFSLVNRDLLLPKPGEMSKAAE
jgi:hypothetical protein